MHCHRYYVRSHVPGLSIEAQRAKIPDVIAIYEDKLSEASFKKLLRAKTTEDKDELLPQRRRMFAPTSRPEPETIGVASLRCLGFNVEDLLDCLERAANRNASIYDIETGELFPPSDEAARLRKAAAAFIRRSRQEQTKEARRIGVDAAAAAKNKEKRLAIARQMYGDPQYTVVQIIKKSGCSRTELWREFGGISEAKKKWKPKKDKGNG